MSKVMSRVFSGELLEGEVSCGDVVEALEKQMGCRFIVYNEGDDCVEHGGDLIEELEERFGYDD